MSSNKLKPLFSSSQRKTLSDLLVDIEWACSDDVSRWCAECGADWHNEHFSDCSLGKTFHRVAAQINALINPADAD